MWLLSFYNQNSNTFTLTAENYCVLTDSVTQSAAEHFVFLEHALTDKGR